MRGALFSALGDRASLHQDTKEADDGALEVNLTQLGDLTPQDRKQIVAQVVKSLAGVTQQPDPGARRGRADRRRTSSEWRPADVNSGESLITPERRPARHARQRWAGAVARGRQPGQGPGRGR